MLTDQRIEYIRDKLRAFTPARIQEFNSLLMILTKWNISVIEFHAFTQRLKIEVLTKLSPEHQHWKRIAPACPDCGNRVDLIGIKTPKGKANIHGYRSQWVCSHPECIYEKYSTRQVVELRKERERLYNKSKTL